MFNTVTLKNKTKKGPANIFNDLDYKTWLKFQKSFERYEFSQDNLPTNFINIVKSYVLFFTKEIVNDQKSSILTNTIDQEIIPNRKITKVEGNPLDKNWISKIREKQQEEFDYIILLISLEKDNTKEVKAFYATLAHILKQNAYSTIFFVEKDDPYPIIWKFANASRDLLLLSDEKILLDRKNEMPPVYALQFRKARDKIACKLFDHYVKSIYTHAHIPKYIIPRSPPRKKDEFKHPAKFPESLIIKFVKLFTEENDWVLDVMAGTGSTLIAANRSKRNSVGIELDDEFFKIAKKRIMNVNPPTRLPGFKPTHVTDLIQGDARNLTILLDDYKDKIKYCITSPPYWDMLHNPGSEGQRTRRKKGLKLVYSKSGNDLGNINDYSIFMETLNEIYRQVSTLLVSDGRLTVIVKNVKRNGYLYTFAWDLVDELAGKNGLYDFSGYTLWCQDDVGLKPFAIGHHWVSNILHHYCLHFQLRT